MAQNVWQRVMGLSVHNELSVRNELKRMWKEASVGEVICGTVPEHFLSLSGERRNWRL